MNRFAGLIDDDADETPTAPVWRHKWQRVLFALMGRPWHTLEAVRELHSTCLHSDVANLERRGLRFIRERITVAGFGGSKTPVTRYRLAGESYHLARQLLGLAAHQSQPDEVARDYRKATGG